VWLDPNGSIAIMGMGLGLVFFGAGPLIGMTPDTIKIPGVGEITLRKSEIPLGRQVERKELPPEVKAEREAYAEDKPVPGIDAPPFNLLTDIPDIKGMPGADPMVPMYMLDKNYRILDWNEAFGLAFDRTMEGRRGMSVLEWTYLLENYEQVLNHGIKVFSDIE